MTVAVAVLSIALAGALAAIVYLVRRREHGIETEVSAGKAQVDAELGQRSAERERDDALLRAAKSEAEAAEAREQLADTQAALVKLREEKSREAATKIRCAPDLDAAVAELDRLFATVPTAATAAAVPELPAGDDPGHDG